MHSVSLQLRHYRARAELSQARLGDPVAVVSVRLPTALRKGAGRAGALTLRRGSAAANVTVARPAPRRTHLVTDRVPSRLVPAASDEFNSNSLGAGWEWVRPDSQAQITGGSLRWPTEAADLVGVGNDAGVLLRRAPRGDWAVETKLTIDLGEGSIRNYQQAGLIVYAGDDLFTRLSHVAIWNTRQTEFGKEMPYAGALSYGGTIIGPPAGTTYLRISHQLDPVNGEHELRGWSSRDGRTWVKGGVWTLPAGAELRIGLVSHGGAGATAQFDWFHTYQ
jgi:hypothetical protein